MGKGKGDKKGGGQNTQKVINPDLEKFFGLGNGGFTNNVRIAKPTAYAGKPLLPEATERVTRTTTEDVARTQTKEEATRFIGLSDGDWSKASMFSTNVIHRPLVQNIYAACASCVVMDPDSTLPPAAKEILIREIDRLAEAGDKDFVIENAVWKEMGLISVYPLFEKILPYVKEITDKRDYNIEFQTGERTKFKNPELKRSVAERTEREINAIREEKIVPIIVQYMKDHHLQNALDTPEKLFRDALSSSENVEALAELLYLDKNKDSLRAAAERKLKEQTPLEGDAALLAPLKKNDLLEMLDSMAYEAGIAMVSRLASGIIDARSAHEEYYKYTQMVKHANSADPAAKTILRETAMTEHHGKACELAQISLHHINDACKKLDKILTHPDLTIKTQLPAGAAKEAARAAGRLKTGYPDNDKTEMVLNRYKQWLSTINNIGEADPVNTAIKKPRKWLSMAGATVENAHQALLNNALLFQASETALQSLAAAEAEGHKPTQEELEAAYRNLSMTHVLLHTFANALKEVSEGIPASDMSENIPPARLEVIRDIERKIQFRAKQQMEFLQSQQQVLDKVYDAMNAELDTMDKAWLQADMIKYNATAFVNMLEARQQQWEAYKTSQHGINS